MAISVNKHILIGRVGADPETRGQDGQIVSFNVATSRSWKDKHSGERVENTSWHKIVIFNEQAANFAKSYVKKGDMVYIEGAVETRKWEKDGQDVYITETVLRPFESVLQLQSKDSGGQSESRSNTRSNNDSGGRGSSRSGGDHSSSSGGNFSRDLDDEIPF